MLPLKRLLTILLLIPNATWAQPSQQWLLTADRIFDGELLHEQYAILINGDVIAAVAPRSEFESLPTVDLGSSTLLPGFIEPHAHLIFRGIPQEIVLQHGITTVQDLGGPSREMSGGNGTLRILSAGPILTPVNGYPIPGLGEADIARPIASVEEGRTAVRELAKQGASVIKVALEPGGEPGAPWSSAHEHRHSHQESNSPRHKAPSQPEPHDAGAGDWPIFPRAIVTAIVEEAHAAGLEVAAHIGEERGATIALDSGVDQWTHVPCLELPETLLQRAAAQSVKIITTSDTLSHCPGVFNNLQLLAAHSADLYYGSEIAHQDVPWGINGQELANLVQYAGMSPQEAVNAATAKAARLLGMPLLGTLTAGAIADIIAVPGNPLISAQDLKALEYPTFVVSGGIIIVDKTSR